MFKKQTIETETPGLRITNLKHYMYKVDVFVKHLTPKIEGPSDFIFIVYPSIVDS